MRTQCAWLSFFHFYLTISNKKRDIERTRLEKGSGNGGEGCLVLLSALFMHTMLFESAAVIGERQFFLRVFLHPVCEYFYGCGQDLVQTVLHLHFLGSLAWPRTIFFVFKPKMESLILWARLCLRWRWPALKVAFNSQLAPYKSTKAVHRAHNSRGLFNVVSSCPQEWRSGPFG